MDTVKWSDRPEQGQLFAQILYQRSRRGHARVKIVNRMAGKVHCKHSQLHVGQGNGPTEVAALGVPQPGHVLEDALH